MAMGELKLRKMQQVYLEVNRKAGWLSMRTSGLDEIEKLKATVLAVGDQPESDNHFDGIQPTCCRKQFAGIGSVLEAIR